MKTNLEKIDEAVLALLHLTSFREGSGEFAITCAWKGHDWEALNRLHEKGLISDPKNKNKSIVLTDQGAKQSEFLFEQLFCEQE